MSARCSARFEPLSLRVLARLGLDFVDLVGREIPSHRVFTFSKLARVEQSGQPPILDIATVKALMERAALSIEAFSRSTVTMAARVLVRTLSGRRCRMK